MRPPRRFLPPTFPPSSDTRPNAWLRQPASLPSAGPLPRGPLDAPVSLPRGLLDPAGVPSRGPARPVAASTLEGGNSEDRLYGEEGGDQLAPIPPHKPQVTDWGLQPILAMSQWRLRGTDAYGSGAYRAPRKDSTGKIYEHQGLDVAVAPGTPILSPADGVIRKIGPAYKNVANDPTGGKLKEIEVESKDGHRIQVMYVVPRDGLAVDMPVRAGEAIGQSDDMTAGRKGMTNHVHIQIPANREKTIFFDPTPWVLSWIKRHRDD